MKLQPPFEVIISEFFYKLCTAVRVQKIYRGQGHSVEGVVFYNRIHWHVGENQLVTDFQLIFTKLDETSSLGNLYNIRQYAGKPIAYVTCGQNVPDDIEVFNAQKTVKQLLSETAL